MSRLWLVLAPAVLAVTVAASTAFGGAHVAARPHLEILSPAPGVIGPDSLNGGPIYVPGRPAGYSFRLQPATPATQGTVIYGQHFAGGKWHTDGHATCTYEPGFRSCVGGFIAKYVPRPGYTLYRACLSPRDGCTKSDKAFVGRLHKLTDLMPVAHSVDFSIGPIVIHGHSLGKSVRFHASGPTESFVEYDLRGTCPYVRGPTSADDNFYWEDYLGNTMEVTLKVFLDGVQRDQEPVPQGAVASIGDGVKTDWGAKRLRITGSAIEDQPTISGPPDPHGPLGGYYGVLPAGTAICAW